MEPIIVNYTLAETNEPCITNNTEKLNNSNIIKNVSTDQTEILHSIGLLYNNGSCLFDCDITASTLKFYGKSWGRYCIPEPRMLMDVNPSRDDIVKIYPWGTLPLTDNSIGSIVIDLPFLVFPQKAPSVSKKKDRSNIIFNRFSSYYPVDNLYFSYYHWISEAYRVLHDGGICIFKTQSIISGGIRHNTEEFSFMAAQRVGFKMVDSFTLLAKSRIISSGKYKNGQKHSRNYISKFLIFKKESKVRNKEFNYERLLDICEEKERNGYYDIVEK